MYLWQCDINGDYSMYSDRVRNENFLRGVQEADSAGRLKFVSIFPGAYTGRWPHIHFEVYPSLDDATSASNKLRTSQIALPADVCDTVYATAGGRVFVTTNGGAIWVEGTGVTAAVTDLVVQPGASGTAYAAAGTRVLRTTNAGLSWLDVTGNLPAGRKVTAVALDAAGGTVLSAPGSDSASRDPGGVTGIGAGGVGVAGAEAGTTGGVSETWATAVAS